MISEFIFGMEESCGYLSNCKVRDKDGVNATLLLCEMAQCYKNKRLTLQDKMEELYHKYGYYLNTQKSYRFDGIDGAERINEVMKRFTWPLRGFENLQIVNGIDYSEGYKDLPPSNVREYIFFNGSRFAIRPSGTESKLKVYIEVTGDDETDTEYKTNEITSYIEQLIR